MIETVVVAGVVLAATAYIGRRALRTLGGRSTGCSSGGGPCPAATSLASDIRRAARRGCRPPKAG